MSGTGTDHSPAFGGEWTLQKLDILQRYLDAYTTALKNTPFRLAYIDPFAGTGHIGQPDQDDHDIRRFVQGSASRALDIQDRPFDRLIFVERDPDRCRELEDLKTSHPERDIQVVNCDANRYLTSLQEYRRGWRGVLFLDPFATEVEWSAIERIAEIGVFDTWILFPVSALMRMLPQSRLPDDIHPRWAARLTTVFGNDDWRKLYQENPQGSLFGDTEHERAPGIDGLLRIYKDQLHGLFGNRYIDQSRSLKNTTNSVLFELLFCVGSSNPNAVAIAKRIAGHILNNL